MKTFIFILFSFLFFSCQSAGEKQAAYALPGDTAFVNDSVKQVLLKVIEGGWVNEEYMKILRETNSPMAAASSGIAVQQMAFDISNLEGDTLLNVIGRLNYNESERFDVIFYKKTGGAAGMKLTDNRDYPASALELNYSIEGDDTILLMNMRNGKTPGITRYRRQFRKFSAADEIPVTAMEYLVNKNLFAGKWKLDNEEVQFTEKGEVKNFSGFKRYSVSTVEQEPGSRPDEISFYNDSAGVTYAFTVKNNTIQLYEISESDDGLHFSRGRMIGELKRE